MPRDKSELNALKESKKKTSTKKSRFPPGEIYLCVLGNGSLSSSRALYMFTDHSRYLFNCGEGTQRLANEHKMKLAKLENIFITHKSWNNTGGLLGMSLTMQDMSVSEISLHGPPDLDLLFKHSGAFVFLNNLKITTKSFNETFVDDCMEVKQIPIFKTSNTSNSTDLIDENIYTSSSSNDSTSDEQSSKRQRLSDQKHSCDVTVAYACKGHSRPGTLSFEKCTEFNVPVGPLLGDLKNGKDVILPSGKIVLSKDVVSPEQVCSTFLVVECPSEDFLESFVNEKQFAQYQEISIEDSEKTAALVVHFTPSNIVKLPRYQEWMKRFPNTTCHLMLNDDCGTLNSLAVHCVQHQLNLLHPDIFSLLHEKSENSSSLYEGGSILLGRTLDRYYLRPANGFDRSHAVTLDPNRFREEALSVEGFSDSLSTLKTAINEFSRHKLLEDKFPSVAFLGTGSCIPSKARNVSAILVNTSENKFILLDCGEGTYSQLLRLYGPLTENIILQMSCIFISHIHADHHLGLMQILLRREELFKKANKEYEKVVLIGPTKMLPWLKDFSRTFHYLKSLYRFIECSALQHDELFNTHCKIDINTCNDILISTVPVIHCPDSHAAIISSKTANWKLVYSGDTMPCKTLVEAGKDCSLLIHEATMEDELAEEAAMKKHSTTGQAIEVAEVMKAQYTLLTHFSQRYAKVPLFNEKFHNKIGCAFDNMKVCPRHFHILPLLIPTLNALFAEYVEDIHIKGEKRRQRAKLLESMLTSQLEKCTN